MDHLEKFLSDNVVECQLGHNASRGYFCILTLFTNTDLPVAIEKSAATLELAVKFALYQATSYMEAEKNAAKHNNPGSR